MEDMLEKEEKINEMVEEEEEEEEDKAIAARAPIPAEHFFAVVLAGIATTVPTHRP